MPSSPVQLAAVGEVGPGVARGSSCGAPPLGPRRHQPLDADDQRVEHDREDHAEHAGREDLRLEVVLHAVRIRLPSPPYDTSVPTVVSATVETVATRRPAMITGSASGSSIRNSSRVVPYPSPVADSRTSSGTAEQPREHVADQDREGVEREPDHDGRRGDAR